MFACHCFYKFGKLWTLRTKHLNCMIYFIQILNKRRIHIHHKWLFILQKKFTNLLNVCHNEASSRNGLTALMNKSPIGAAPFHTSHRIVRLVKNLSCSSRNSGIIKKISSTVCASIMLAFSGSFNGLRYFCKKEKFETENFVSLEIQIRLFLLLL